MNRGTLDHALKRGGRDRLGTVDISDQRRQVIFDEFKECLAQLLEIHRTGLHDLGRVWFVDQSQKQVLQRCEFMAPRIGQRQRGVNGLLERIRKRRHLLCSLRRAGGAWARLTVAS